MRSTLAESAETRTPWNVTTLTPPPWQPPIAIAMDACMATQASTLSLPVVLIAHAQCAAGRLQLAFLAPCMRMVLEYK